MLLFLGVNIGELYWDGAKVDTDDNRLIGLTISMRLITSFDEQLMMMSIIMTMLTIKTMIRMIMVT